MTHDEMIAVIQAHKEGKTIEFSYKAYMVKHWAVSVTPQWDFSHYDYRAKPEPRVLHCVFLPTGGIYSRTFTEEEAKDFIATRPGFTYAAFVEKL